MKKSATILFLTLFISGCATTTTPSKTEQDTTSKETPAQQEIAWKPYSNTQLGFTINVPEKVLTDFNDEKSLKTLNIFEDGKSVYFSTYTLEETLQNKTSDFIINGTTVKDEIEIVPFLESNYGVKGCAIESHEDPSTGFFNIIISADDKTLSPEDPNSCFIGGKIRTMYDKTTGKLITYQFVEQFFFEPGGSVGEKALESLKFVP
jgi:hypothetical protein